MKLPKPVGKSINSLVVGKAILATGCTAISLTKTAIQIYSPRRIIIASIFYSSQGVDELLQELPNADIFLVGKPDKINIDGMLEPGIGNLDKRIRSL